MGIESGAITGVRIGGASEQSSCCHLTGVGRHDYRCAIEVESFAIEVDRYPLNRGISGRKGLRSWSWSWSWSWSCED